MVKDFVSFSINQKPYIVRSDATSWITRETKLVDFIRDEAKLKGTKYLCREGGCGACVVQVKSKDPLTGKETVKSTNSCLTPILNCDGWDIFTVENLGNRKDGYDPLQKRLAEFSGTQCGFCTPGMVMSMHSLLEARKEITVKDIEDCLDGNICRCTGYRSILDAFKTFATDPPAELFEKCREKQGCLQCPCAEKVSKKSGPTCCSSVILSNLTLQFPNGRKWLKTTSLDSLYDAMQNLSQENMNYRLIAGNTGIGLFKDTNLEEIDTLIDISSIPELHKGTYSPTVVSLGTGLSITEAVEKLQGAAEYHENFKYASIIAKHFSLRIGNTHIRNVSTLAGNLALRNEHPEFVSDVLILFEAVQVQITIGCCKTRNSKSMTMMEFLKADLTGKVILSVNLFPLSKDCILKSYKVSPRYQNSKGYINAAFLFRFVKSQNYRILQKPTIIFGGINPKLTHAAETEEFFNGKSILDVKTLQLGMQILDKELNPNEVDCGGSAEYRGNLAKSLLYKAMLEILDKDADPKVLSGAMELVRGIRKGVQTFVKNQEKSILYKGFPKLESLIQCSGEAEFTNDIPKADGELFGAFVLTTLANAKIKRIDPTAALKIKGVHYFIEAKDIPGKNNYMIWEPTPEEIFVSKDVKHAGQPVGLILAETRELAFLATKKVFVEYEDVTKPILSIKASLQQAQKDSKLEECAVKTFKSPNDTGSVANYTLKGEFNVGGQHHFQMEPHSCLCIPNEDGLNVFSATQWIDKTQAVISSALDLPVNRINVQVRRLGGGFGGKASRSAHTAAACAVASHVVHRPVRVILDLETHMRMFGKRLPYLITYEVGFDDNGKIVSLHLKVFCDPGFSPNEETTYLFMMNIQNCYEADNWSILAGRALTNTPANTFCRTPGHSQGVAAIEYIMEHIAFHMKKDPWEVRMANMIKQGDSLIHAPGLVVEDQNPIQAMITKFKGENDFSSRTKVIEDFNKVNRWKKRGMAVTPLRFPNHYIGGTYPVYVGIYHVDGSVVISHGGIEMGQGIHTKVAQVVAETLGVPLNKVTIKATNNLVSPNSCLTAAGTTSESCCYAAVEACKILKDRMAGVKLELKDETWEKVVSECHKRAIDLTASFMNQSTKDGIKGYDVWGLNMTEVEIDVLTGEYRIIRLDFSIDGTKSLNPEVDLGQVEGALVFGLGLWTTEKLIYDRETGQLLTHGTWDYKPPEPKDIPEDFRVTIFSNDTPNKRGVLGSKGPGEASLCSAVCVLFALKRAINSARADAGDTTWFQLDGPVTPEDVMKHCLTASSQFFL